MKEIQLAKNSYEELEKENKELKDQLTAEHRLFDTLADSVSDVVYILDPDSKIIEVNKRVEDYGYKTAELRGRLFSDIVPDNFKETAKQIVIERREKLKEIEDGTRKEYSQTVVLPFIVKPDGTTEMHVSDDSFISDFGVQTVRIHKGEPIKKNHIYTVGIARDITKQKKNEREKEQLIADLEYALAEVKELSGLLPICASCKNIRDDKGYWSQIELYIERHSEAKFSHGICPDCLEELYPKQYEKMKKEGKNLNNST